MSIREYWVNGYPVEEIKAYTARTGYKKLGESTFIYETPPFTLCIDYVLQPTGFGQKPLLICPRCGSRHTKLYHAGSFMFCRDCLPAINPYHGIQNNTKQGSDYITYIMDRLAKKYGVDYFTVRDFLANNWIEADNRPHYMRKATFADLVGRLNMLDDRRCICIWGKYIGRGSTVQKWELDYICHGKPIDLMQIDLYRGTIELAEEVYKLPIKERLIAKDV